MQVQASSSDPARLGPRTTWACIPGLQLSGGEGGCLRILGRIADRRTGIQLIELQTSATRALCWFAIQSAESLPTRPIIS